MGRERTRFGLYMIVGAYLIYLAYQMYQNPDANSRSMVINVFMVLFLVIGIGLLIFGGWLLYQNVKHPQVDDTEKEEQEESIGNRAEKEQNETKYVIKDAQKVDGQSENKEKISLGSDENHAKE
ncbi:MAG: hypothetical protein Q4P26_01845 [Lachnospiraceae bacterium]|nr:hypothetical protein [Lachnospiraceae bacterium]